MLTEKGFYVCTRCTLTFNYWSDELKKGCKKCRCKDLITSPEMQEYTVNWVKITKTYRTDEERLNVKIQYIEKTLGRKLTEDEIQWQRNWCNEAANIAKAIVNKPVNQPKCPTCKSTNIRKIGTLERGASVGMFGLFSKKINKTFKCNNCDYTW